MSIDKITRPNYRPQYAPRSSNKYSSNNYLMFRSRLNAPRPFYQNQQPQTRKYCNETPDSPLFVHQT